MEVYWISGEEDHSTKARLFHSLRAIEENFSQMSYQSSTQIILEVEPEGKGRKL